jgi:hypothetical protein
MHPTLDPSVLFALAEIAVALAGFSAIVVIFRRRESGKWRVADAERFHGMVLHAVAAAFFCLLPSLVGVFVESTQLVWNLCSAALGLQITAHVALVLRFTSTGGASRAVLSMGFVAAALQVFNLFGIGYSHEFAPYLFGVLWHVLQSGVLFVWLIWIPAEDVEPA